MGSKGKRLVQFFPLSVHRPSFFGFGTSRATTHIGPSHITDVLAQDRREIAGDNVSKFQGGNRKPQQPTTVPPLSD